MHELPTTIPGPSETLIEKVCGGIAIAGIDHERRRVEGCFSGVGRPRTGERVQQGQLRAWGKQGGRPGALDGRAIARLKNLLAVGKSQAECARMFGVSVRTIGRAVAWMRP